MAALNGIKMETDPPVKSEPPDHQSPAFMDDDEGYEDTGELTVNQPFPGIWLTRIPKYLWERLEKLQEDDEVQIGEIKVWQAMQGGREQQVVKAYFNRDLKGFEYVPKSWDLTVSNGSSKNIFVFTEKDMEGYKPNIFGRAKADVNSLNQDRTQSGRVGKRGARFRRAIPKHTALVATAQHEMNMTPIENEEFWRIQEAKSKEKFTTQEQHFKGVPITALNHMNANADKSFKDFIRPANARPRQKQQENKAARIDEGELLSILEQCFHEYKFWPLKALKQRTKQPEAFLKEVLSKIAELIRSGPYANNWALRTDLRIALDAKNKEETHIAPDDLGGGSESEPEAGDAGDESDDVEMENVAL